MSKHFGKIKNKKDAKRVLSFAKDICNGARLQKLFDISGMCYFEMAHRYGTSTSDIYDRAHQPRRSFQTPTRERIYRCVQSWLQDHGYTT